MARLVESVAAVDVDCKRPVNPTAPTSLTATTRLHWRDQFVVALGTAFDLADGTTLWAGYNYGRNPIPTDTVIPLLAAIATEHLTAGIGYRPWPGWLLGASLEYQLPVSVNATGAGLPLGSDLRIHAEYLALHLGIRREG